MVRGPLWLTETGGIRLPRRRGGPGPGHAQPVRHHARANKRVRRLYFYQWRHHRTNRWDSRSSRRPASRAPRTARCAPSCAAADRSTRPRRVKWARCRVDTGRVSTQQQAGATALDALIDAAAGILAADSLKDTLGRIAHHLQALLPYDDLTVYEVDVAGTGLSAGVRARAWVQEIISESLSVGPRDTRLGWSAATGARGTVPELSRFDDISTVVPVPTRRVRVRATARRRSSWAGRLQRLILHRRSTARPPARRGSRSSSASRRSRALLPTGARAEARAPARQAATDGLDRSLNHRAAQEHLRRDRGRGQPPAPPQRRGARPRPLQADQRPGPRGRATTPAPRRRELGLGGA